MKRILWVSVVGFLAIFAISIIAAFSIIYVRKHSLDRQRVHDILALSWRIDTYYYLYGNLPSVLSDLKKMDDVAIPNDPANGYPYTYRIIDHSTFKLCATFAMPSPNFSDLGNQVRYGDPIVHGYGTWVHGRGEQCINRTIMELPNLQKRTN